MRRIERSALVPYSAEIVFDVVNDVESYPAFLPWCSNSEILSRSPTEVVVRLDVSSIGMKKSFTTKNQLYPSERIELSLVEGPFTELEGYWRFTPINDSGCKIEMALTFEFDSSLLNAAFTKVFKVAADKLVDSFCARVELLHG
ncbi:MAG TPA: ubiquinone-binding protein [Gammaproteobacteria bacterium]|nr:ubiquinone-binding protein [Gammaproteobacteria bacterium]|tara:strand:+ start:1458 stop:1889 length:432 start_codon:yes stop_codon:yes gene_type:complete